MFLQSYLLRLALAVSLPVGLLSLGPALANNPDSNDASASAASTQVNAQTHAVVRIDVEGDSTAEIRDRLNELLTSLGEMDNVRVKANIKIESGAGDEGAEAKIVLVLSGSSDLSDTLTTFAGELEGMAGVKVKVNLHVKDDEAEEDAAKDDDEMSDDDDGDDKNTAAGMTFGAEVTHGEREHGKGRPERVEVTTPFGMLTVKPGDKPQWRLDADTNVEAKMNAHDDDDEHEANRGIAGKLRAIGHARVSR